MNRAPDELTRNVYYRRWIPSFLKAHQILRSAHQDSSGHRLVTDDSRLSTDDRLKTAFVSIGKLDAETRLRSLRYKIRPIKKNRPKKKRSRAYLYKVEETDKGEPNMETHIWRLETRAFTYFFTR